MAPAFPLVRPSREPFRGRLFRRPEALPSGARAEVRTTLGSAAAPPDRERKSTRSEHSSVGFRRSYRTDAPAYPETPAFPDMLARLIDNSGGIQRSSVLNELISALGPAGPPQIPGLSGLQRGRPTVKPQDAERVAPETVREMAEQAEKQAPSIVERISYIYAQHPRIVKT